MLDSLNCLSQSACLLLEECARFAGWSLEFGGCPAAFLAFCGAACRSGRESQLLVVLGPSGRVHSSRRPTDPQLRVQEISKPGQAARTDKRHDPRTRIILGISSRLPIGDPSPIPRRCTPTAPHTTDNFPFVLNSHLANPPPEKQSPMAALRTGAASGPPISQVPRRPSLSGGTACMYIVQLDRCDLGASPHPPCRYRVTDGKGVPCGVSTKSLELDEAPKVAGATSHSIEAYIGVAQCSRDLRRPASRWLPALSKEAKEHFDDGRVLVR